MLMALAYVAGAIYIESNMIFDPLGPRTFPILCGGIVAVSCLFLLVRPDPEPDWPAFGRAAEIGAVVIGLIGYAYLLPVLGFVVATTGAAAALSWRLGAKVLFAPVTGLAIAVGIYAVFHWILGLALPHGTWTSDLLGGIGVMQPLNDAVVGVGDVISSVLDALFADSPADPEA